MGQLVASAGSVLANGLWKEIAT